MNKKISVVIPNHNGSDTIGKCLEAAFSSRYDNFEVIVVDDCSKDNSIKIIEGFPCKLIRLEKHAGASKTRNTGAVNSCGDIIFFTDADCLMKEDALSIANKTLSEEGPDTIVGGTYTMMPYDKIFFSMFQSVFINYSETKNLENPDYIATHTMAIDAQTFKKSKGFPEVFMPIIEDVEFSHRLRRSGARLIIKPEMLVQHIFGYSLGISLRNAFKKSKYWTMYSIKNRDVFVDSGTASVELKINVASCFLSFLLLLFWIASQKAQLFYPLPLMLASNIFINRRLIQAFYRTNGILFAALATLYYMAFYPLAVGVGAFAGILKYYLSRTTVNL